MKTSHRTAMMIGLLTLVTIFSLIGSGYAAEGDIKIGVITSRSGVLQEWGTQELRGLTLGLEYATKGTNTVLGRKIELIIEDDAVKPQIGVQKAVKLLAQDKVDILTGVISSGIALAVMEKAQEYKTPYIVSCASSDAITGKNFNPYTFRVGRSLGQATTAAAKYLVKNVGKKFAILAPDYAGGRGFASVWKRDIEANGGKVVMDLYAPLSTTDFSSYLQKIKYSGADVLLGVFVGSNFTTKLPRQIVEMGLDKKMKLAGDIADIAFLEAIGDAGEGLVGSVIYYYELFDTPLNKWLVEHHKKAYNVPPDLWTANAFATGIVIVEAIKKAGTTDAQALVKALEGLEFDDPKTDAYRIRIRPEDHQAMQTVPVVTLKKGLGEAYPTPKLSALPDPKTIAQPITAIRK